ncbi:MFS transporter, DHA2 family, multidrug resistance protein [Tistlia consotensis]|uniref:MFS transporter, DHA2 family, multidrug resistance protein n=1 Tax=Tistlia consotensis USBA 355 TaxID=560819 RepID=A0A1Y6BDJ4_9PROT|nr:DHA2 family efflux MFS transporter permease subunit [Tistlia consotensis]SMF02183.1 MFS transporter, DHA2 family, multidrug resistance protein [Tistlia consotensis USBA 355]SNS26416.1 MFS transporter, DHA2 family, multidrug resistance protein [Tistlia consotensis]
MTAAASGGAGGEPNRALVTVSIMLATIMQALDTTIANVALPHIQGSMSATQDQISWVLTSYIVAAAIMTPPTGFLAARFGRKRIFAVSIIGFTVASMLCGAATSLPEIVAFRLLQGMFGAGLVPLSQSVLLDTYPKEQHGQAMAIWGMGVMVGPILGPTLGGYLTDLYSWRYTFYVNLPFGALALTGILLFVHETERDGRRPFDLFGFALLSIAIGALQMMLDRGQSQDWFSAREIIFEAVAAGLFFYLFLVQMFTAEHPFLEPKLFTDRNLAVGLFFIFIVGIVLLATLALLPPFLQDLMGFPVLTAGLVLAPRGIGTMAAMFLVGRLIRRVDIRLLVLFGLGMTAYSLWQMAEFTTEVSSWTVIRSGMTQGMGLGFLFVPLSTVTFATLDPKLRTEGASMFSLMRNIGSSIGISVVVTLLAENTQVLHSALAAHVSPLNPMMHAPFLPGAWSLGSTAGLAALNQQITDQALTIGYLDDFRLMMWLVLGAIPFLLLLRSPKRTAQRQAEMAAALD